MTDYPREQVETIRERFESGAYDDVTDADAEVLLEVSDEIDILGPSRYSDQRHEFILKRGLASRKVRAGSPTR